MTERDLMGIERVAVLVLLVLLILSGFDTDLDFALGVGAGGVINLLNVRALRYIFRPLVKGDGGAGWSATLLALKLGTLFSLVLFVGLWLEMNLVGFLVGFSSVIAAVALYKWVPFLWSFDD